MSQRNSQGSNAPRKKVVRKNKKKKIDRSSLIILITLIVIGIPCIIVGYELIHAQLGTHSPVIGNRYENDLSHEISKDQLTSVEDSMKSIGSVEDVEVNLATTTLRIYLNYEDNATKEDIEAGVNQAYEKLGSILDMTTYFSQASGEKMYDLEIHGYNNVEFASKDDGSYIYYILNKSSSMEAPHVQLVSEPLDPELAASLREEPEEETESSEGDVSLGSEEVVTPTPSAESEE